jgi:hypothetical protein
MSSRYAYILTVILGILLATVMVIAIIHGAGGPYRGTGLEL